MNLCTRSSTSPAGTSAFCLSGWYCQSKEKQQQETLRGVEVRRVGEEQSIMRLIFNQKDREKEKVWAKVPKEGGWGCRAQEKTANLIRPLKWQQNHQWHKCHHAHWWHFLDNLLMESLVLWTIYLERRTTTTRHRYMQRTRHGNKRRCYHLS